MERKSKSEILPLPSSRSEPAFTSLGSRYGQNLPNPPASSSGSRLPPQKPGRSMTCLDLTMQCVVFQDSRASGNGPPGTNTSNTALLNMNQRMNQMKAQKEMTSVQMYSQRMVRLRMTQNQRRQILPWFGSTVVVPQGLG